MAIYELGDLRPSIDPSAFVFEGAILIGQVTLKANVSIWPGVVIRADNDSIIIDENSNVQEGSVLHIDRGTPLYIGKNVTVGHKVMLHGCTIGDGSLIGMSATILNHAVIGKNCIIGAGALIPEGKIIPDNSVVVGVAKIVREVTAEDLARSHEGTRHYVEQGNNYREKLKRID
ncbi:MULTISPECIES: gamma carbonic anhydrase family protein [Oligella]|uniref:Anhydrase n=2 Tax=Oligella urethralis TaxID=90245 RepID=A0A095YYJ5_9BURK|nr:MULTISPECIES: gamma carbonic anhydrase family protein [Oligella]AVL71196.1 gamma carbonic anhydrase family protein [Oligella urethralis]KGF27186.1 anhydrase [Oligella urethralis DNF00040]MDK6202607.1 gamma carbonic anhydrase family protein [Oligella urethralis]OFS83308.1 gamma carbonic anhydrase family protein [Oligella sp. HMSC05A10]SPY06855.1 carnitine operon protein CaiE [Oligella urethralis]